MELFRKINNCQTNLDPEAKNTEGGVFKPYLFISKNYYLMKNRILLAFTLAFTQILFLNAQCIWDGSTGNWSDATKWSCGHVPTATENVAIYGGTVTLDVAVSIADLHVGVPSFMPTILTGNNNITISGTLNWIGGASIGGTGTMTVAGLANLNYGFLGRTLILNGGATLANFGTHIPNSPNPNKIGTLIIPVNKTLVCTNNDISRNSTIGGDGTVVNQGTIEKNGTGDLSLFAPFTNTGTINIKGGRFLINYQAQYIGTHTGAVFNIDDGAIYEQFDGIHDYTNCTISGDGKFNIGDSFGPRTLSLIPTANFISGNTVSSNIEFLMESATLNLNHNITLADASIYRSTVNGTGTMIIPVGSTAKLKATFNSPLTNQGTIESVSLIANNIFTNSGIIKGGETGGNPTGAGSIDLTNATVNNTGTISPGYNYVVGPYYSIGNMRMVPFNNATSTLAIELSRLGDAGFPDFGNDQVTVQSATTLSGTLNISFINGFTPSVGNSFTIMTCPSCPDGQGFSGNFTTITHPNTNPNAWQIDLSTPKEVHLVLVQPLNLPCTWDGSTGNWSNASKWSCGYVPTTLDNIVINSGTVTLDVVDAHIFTFNLSGGILNSGGNNLTLSGALTWSGGTLGGSGTMEVMGAATITNAPTLDTRTLKLSGSGTINGSFNTNNGANLLIPTGKTLICTVNSDVVWGGNGGTLTVAGTFSKMGTGVLELGFQNVQNTGTVNVSGNTLRMGADGTHNGATFNVDATKFISVKGGTHSFTGCHFMGNGSLATIGSSIVSTFTGNDFSSNFGLSLQQTSTFALGQNVDVSSFLIGGTAVLNGIGNLTVGTTSIFGGTIDFDGSFNIITTLTWFLGGTIGSNVQTKLIYPATGTSNNNVTMNGTFRNGGTFTVQSGTFTVNGAYYNHESFSIGILNIEAGTFDANNIFSNIGELKGKGTLDLTDATTTSIGYVSPGLSPGILNIVGNYANNGGILNIELGGTTLGTDYDRLNITGTATLSNGYININLVNGYTPQVGHSFTILDAQTLTGTFPAPASTFQFEGFNWTIQYNEAQGTIVLNVVSVVVLPVELLTFKAQNTEGGNLLTWQTATERNTRNFDIERSTDSKTFDKIATVKATGNTQTPQYYTFLDEKPFDLTYYRLKINDLDNKYTYSKTESVSRQYKGFTVKAYPNPFSNDVKIEFSTDKKTDVQIELVDILGRQVFVSKVENTEGGIVPLAIGHLSSGAYLLKVSGNQQTVVQRLIKN